MKKEEEEAEPALPEWKRKLLEEKRKAAEAANEEEAAGEFRLTAADEDEMDVMKELDALEVAAAAGDIDLDAELDALGM